MGWVRGQAEAGHRPLITVVPGGGGLSLPAGKGEAARLLWGVGAQECGGHLEGGAMDAMGRRGCSGEGALGPGRLRLSVCRSGMWEADDG